MGFFNQTLVTAGGVGVAQLINFAATPLLARMYEPREFGLYAVFTAIAGPLVTIACLRFDVALGVAKDDELPAMVTLALAISCIITLLIITGTYFFGETLSITAKLGASKFWLPVAVITGAIIQVVSFQGIHQGTFFLNSLLRVAQALCFVVAAVLWPAVGLIGAFSFGGLVWLWGLKDRIKLPTSIRDLKQLWFILLRKYRDYPLFSAPAAILDTLSLSAPVLLIDHFYGEVATGNYAQVQRVVAAPLLLLTMAIGQVFFNRSATLRRQGQNPRPLMWKIIWILIGLGGVVLVVVRLVGQPIMALLLGSRWRVDSGFLLAVLCPVVIRMCVSPVTSIFLVENRLKIGAFWQVTYFIAAFGVLPFFAASLTFDHFLLALIINESILYTFYLILCDRVACRSQQTSCLSDLELPCAESPESSLNRP